MRVSVECSNRYTAVRLRGGNGPLGTVESIMTFLVRIQKAEQRRRARIQAQYSSLKAYRGVPYEHVTNGKPIHGSLTYRGVKYAK